MFNTVRNRRLAIGMTAAQLARAANIAQSTLYHIETFDADNVSYSLMQRLTHALKSTSVRDLFPGTMCPEIAAMDLRAHKRIQRNGAAEDIVYEELIGDEYPLQVGDNVMVSNYSFHERVLFGKIVHITKILFVVEYFGAGFREAFRWDEFDGSHIVLLKEG